MNLATFISLALCLAFTLSPNPATASADNAADETVAAGIVFKLTYLVSGHGSWTRDPEWNVTRFPKVIAAVSHDLSAFSDSEFGRKLEKEGRELTNFLDLTFSPGDETRAKERSTMLKKLGLDPDMLDPEALAKLVTQKIKNFATSAGVPSWVYQQKAKSTPP